MKKIDVNYYPGWVRKAISFTIDDGNIPMDTKLLSYVKPAGIKGTFNLCSPWKLTPEEYRNLYEGYDIANHCNLHPFPFTADRNAEIKKEPFDLETADKDYYYPTEEEGLYRNHTWEWKYIATDEKYLSLAADCTRDLDAIFGEGTVKDFVWPYGEQPNAVVMQGLIGMGFRSIRRTGEVRDRTRFSLPSDRMHWSYNANHKTVLEVADLYEVYPDDGELKLYCFGVHSIDFERDNNWCDVEEFCNRFGNRPDKYWYAGMGTIFAYEDAVRTLQITETEIVNNSDVDLSVKIDDEGVVIPAHSSYSIA